MIVHSYARFSDPSQEGGDSLRRQREAAEEYCARKGFTLSDLRFTDKGRSGFKGDMQRALGAFVKAVDSGRVKPGETLLVEAVDRLSRKGIRQTQNLVNKLLDAGINIAILAPVEKVYRASDQNDIGSAIELAAYAFQAHVYSENLSTRIKAYNTNERSKLRNGQAVVLSRVCPSWLELDDNGRFRKKPEAVKAIKYIFKRTIDGIGRKTLCRELNEKFDPIGTRKNSHGWNETMVAKIIKERRVLGEMKSTVTKEKFPDYYPAVIPLGTWAKANAASAKRTSIRGPAEKRVNLFNGILFHAVDGCAMGLYSYQQFRKKLNKKITILRYKSYHATNGKTGSRNADATTVDVPHLEDLVFNFLPTLELTKRKNNPVAELEAEREYLNGEIKTITDHLKGRKQKSANVLGVLDDLEDQLQDVEKKLAAMPTNGQVVPTKTYRQELAKMQRGSYEDRLLVRERIRDIVSRIDIIPVKLGPNRWDRVKTLLEIQFKNGEFVRAIELDDGHLVKVSGKVATPLPEQCADGWRFGVDEYHEAIKLVEKMNKKR